MPLAPGTAAPGERTHTDSGGGGDDDVGVWFAHTEEQRLQITQFAKCVKQTSGHNGGKREVERERECVCVFVCVCMCVCVCVSCFAFALFLVASSTFF